MNQREQVLKYIEDFGSITSYQAYIDLGITQLATRVKELKEQGYHFSYEWITKKNRYGKPVRFKKYKLEVVHENIV
jgi:hypothetical protein